MIYTVTCNPSIDYLVTVDSLEIGKLNRMRKDSYMYGGKGVNVSQVLKELGIDNTALGFVAGFTGREIEEGLNRLGISTDFVHLPEGHSRINIKFYGIEETEVNAPGPFVDAVSMRSLRDRISTIGGEDILILAGAATANMENDIFATLISELPYRDTKVILDTEGEALVNALCYHPFLIKPNLEELSDLFHEQFTSSDRGAIVSAAKRLQDKGARNVLISMGEDGAILVDSDGKEYFRPAPAGIVVNSVGCGDSMVAGFLAGYLERGDLEDALCLGVCAGSTSAFNEGFARGDEIMQLYRLCR
ncbi:MAG: 1-phosphofructokinase [Lachnospiraceae bacterium]|nr:1-phosphofructokinase [Lachnospiraceae bacterium]